MADLLAADRARAAVGMPTDFILGTQGWTLGTFAHIFPFIRIAMSTLLTALPCAGPLVQRSYFDQVLPSDWVLATQGENLGRSPVELEYANISRAQKWVGPWIEDDNGRHAMESWVARTLDYGREAARYHATGLTGIHWRTRPLAPTFAALAMAPWVYDSSGTGNLTSQHLFLDYAKSEYGLDGVDAQRAADALAYCDTPVAGRAQGQTMGSPVVAACRPTDPDGSLGGLCAALNLKTADPGNSFQFVENFAALGQKVRGVENQARWAYQNHMFQWNRAIAGFHCSGLPPPSPPARPTRNCTVERTQAKCFADNWGHNGTLPALPHTVTLHEDTLTQELCAEQCDALNYS